MSLELQTRVLAFINGAPDNFDALALAVFAFQFERNAVYRAYCEQLRRTPPTVKDWKEIPAVPTGAFKEFALTCFPVEEAVAEFHTSGTTREKPGKHFFRTLEVYDAAIKTSFVEHLLPGNERLTMMVMTPSPEEAPHSSLAHMMGVVILEFGTTESAFYVEGGQLQIDRLVRDLCEAQWAHEPVFLLGTAFSFVHLLDHCRREDLRFEMPDGSRVMETGGFKGRSREVPKRDLYGLIERHLGIPANRIVNEYGMTELSTQFYDRTIMAGQPTDAKVVPAWARVLIIDPNTGREAANGERGLIRVLDLANLWSSICLQTEDLGLRRGDGFEVIGRAAGAEVRGCSLTAEDFSVT